MVLTHIYTGQNSGMKMFVWVYVTQGHGGGGGLHPTAELNTAEVHTEASSSGLLQQTHKEPARVLSRCCSDNDSIRAWSGVDYG